MDIRHWYALHTKSRFENVVAERLSAKSLEAFLPKITVPSKRRDRRKMLRIPLFSGYLFVRTDLSAPEHLEIVTVPGVAGLVGTSHGPVPVPDSAIGSLKIMAASENVLTGYRFKNGDPVRVIAGPLAGVVGIFTRYKGADRVIVNIEALGRFAAVETSRQDVELLYTAS